MQPHTNCQYAECILGLAAFQLFRRLLQQWSLGLDPHVAARDLLKHFHEGLYPGLAMQQDTV
jgi:hypothetical protein